jgi:hypothetical protein
MTKLNKILLTIFLFPIFALSVFLPTSPVVKNANAQNILCDVFPFIEGIEFARGLCGDLEGESEDAVATLGSYIRFGLSLVFIAIIGVSIFIIIKAALKYIRSEGDEGKVAEAQKAIKNVFLGVGALIVGIIGLVIILGFFNASGALQTEETPEPLQPLITGG